MLFAMVCRLHLSLITTLKFKALLFKCTSLVIVLFFLSQGYDPALVNPYLAKVLENLGALIYEETEHEGQTFFNITSVVSAHGEQLVLKQVSRKPHCISIIRSEKHTCSRFIKCGC